MSLCLKLDENLFSIFLQVGEVNSTTSSHSSVVASPARNGSPAVPRTPAIEGWQCSTCTFHNKKLKSYSCEMCQSSRSLTALSPPAPAAISRHQSEPSASLRHTEEEQARLKWQRIVGFCRSNGDKFVDDSFLPAGRSLHNSTHEGVQWLRPSQIVSSAASHVK